MKLVILYLILVIVSPLKASVEIDTNGYDNFHEDYNSSKGLYNIDPYDYKVDYRYEKDQFDLERTKAIVYIAQEIIKKTTPDDLIIFPGRSLLWVKEILSLMDCNRTIVHHAFSGPYIKDFINEESRKKYLHYLKEQGISVDIFKKTKGKIVFCDYIMTGRSILGWCEFFNGCCKMKNWEGFDEKLSILGVLYSFNNGMYYDGLESLQKHEGYQKLIKDSKGIKMNWINSAFIPDLAGTNDWNNNHRYSKNKENFTNPLSLGVNYGVEKWGKFNPNVYKIHPYALALKKQLQDCYGELVRLENLKENFQKSDLCTIL